MARLLAAALALTLFAGCGGDDELDRVDGGMEVAPAPAAVDADLDDGEPGEPDAPFVDPDDVYDTTPLETEGLEGVPVPEVGLEDAEDVDLEDEAAGTM